MGLELAEDLGWRLPDVIVFPTGGGTGVIGLWKAFHELEEMGLIDGRRPRMVAVQSEGCAPIVRAFEQGDRFATPWEDPGTRAVQKPPPADLPPANRVAPTADEDEILDLAARLDLRSPNRLTPY